ncbi:MAG TPA: hypothetical protein VK988_12555 [Acidimicrobiales bacterium]|nr:hypothetical protein [Acidimicrobiales bacterium]
MTGQLLIRSVALMGGPSRFWTLTDGLRKSSLKEGSPKQIIDAHTHVGSKDRIRYPVVTEERSEATAWFLDHGVTVEELLYLIDEAEVSAAILVQALGSHGTDNSYVIDSVPTGAGRLVGIGTVDCCASRSLHRLRQALPYFWAR